MDESKSYILGLGQPAIADVLSIAAAQRSVASDGATAQRVKKDSPSPKQFQAEEIPGTADITSEAYVPAEVIRAALFFKLNNVVNGKSKCRLSVVEQACSMLNTGVLPAVDATKTTDREVFSVIADAFHGVGRELSTGASLQVALDGAGIATSLLSTDERLILEDGMACSSGLGAICAEEGKSVVSLATFVAALSAEALKAEVKCFDAEVAETFPLKEVNSVAETLRVMFTGSTQVSLKKNNDVIPAIVDVPAVHGGVSSAIKAVATTCKASLASQSMPPHKSGSNRQYLSASAAQELLSLGGLLTAASSMSLERLGLVLDKISGETELKIIVGGLQSLRDRGKASHQKALRDLCALEADVVTQAPAVACGLVCLDSMRSLSQILCVEVLVAVLGLWTSMRNFAATTAAATVNSKRRPPVYSLGVGTATLIENILRVLHGVQSADQALEALSLEAAAVPAGLVDVEAAAAILARKLSPYDVGFKGFMDSMTRVLEANAAQRKTPKIAKGARDFGPEQMAIREVAFQKITSVFKRHGAVSIDTPVFELRDTLMGKYGEDSKLIYDLADQGGEILSLRYDLTVPFARHVAVHGISNIKRYHIAKVYRRDQPQMSRGRFREFFQCDFDIAGVYSPMVPDAEVLKVLVEILDDLALGDYEVKINHRKILDAMLDIAGVPESKFRPICSAIDKLDKETWETVRKEMIEEKGLAEHVADKIGEFVVLRGNPREVLAKLQDAAHPLAIHSESAKALEDMKLLFDFLEVMGALGPFSFDLSLARGLDYYTGVIYEAVFKGGSVGSIAAGGRYDHLVGMFSNKEVPAVGVSIGIERVFAIIEAQMKEKTKENNGTIRETETEVLIASIGNGMQPMRMAIAADLWRAGIKCEFGFKPNPKIADQLGYSLKSGIPLMVLFGEDEISKGKLKLKDLDAETEFELDRSDLIAAIKEKLAVMGDRRIVFAKSST